MSSQQPYADRRETQRSYRPRAGTMSPGLKRAREPYRIKNAIVGLGLGAFAVGVWAYSISAVKQDVFDDVDEEAKTLAGVSAPSTSVPTSTSPSTLVSATGATSTMSASRAAFTTTVAPSTPAAAATPTSSGALSATNVVVSEPLPPSVPSAVQPRGLFSKWFPKILDPQTGTWVYGAPSVDDFGKARS